MTRCASFVSHDLPILAIVGPTATGKSALGVRLAALLHGEIINADALQLYRGMDCGTAKMTVQEQRGIPHHLLDVLGVCEEASVGWYQHMVQETLAAVRDRGKTPIVVGGSGLYVRAALDRFDIPPTDASIRSRIAAESRLRGGSWLRQRVAEVDPAAAEQIQDARRLVRALEVYELTGRPFSSFNVPRKYRAPTLQIGLNGDRQVLHRRVKQRVYAMAEAGLRQEVVSLAAHGLREGKTASRALGYRQYLRHLDEAEYSEEDALRDTVVATRQFVRRQVTWFNADPRVQWLDFADPSLEQRVLELLAQQG